MRHHDLIVDGLGNIEAVLDADDQDFSKLKLAASMRQRLLDTRGGLDFNRAEDELAGPGISVVGYGSDDYPELLAQIPDAPLMLFCKGDTSMMRHHGVAIVGSRKCSSGGPEISAMLGRGLAELGIPVISGMALGIDGAAHEGALAAPGPTVAVLGCGVDVVYPPRHHELYERLCAEALVISEYPPGTTPDKPHFPQRNRIISGLSRGTVVVEGSLNSGALITARTAIEQGREVFAIPGPIRSPYAKGPHHLIKSKNAVLIECVDDILVEFGTTRADLLNQRQSTTSPVHAAAGSAGGPVQAGAIAANEVEQRVLEHVSYEGTHINELVRKLGFTTAECIAHLTMLEIKGLISTASGGFYIRQ